MAVDIQIYGQSGLVQLYDELLCKYLVDPLRTDDPQNRKTQLAMALGTIYENTMEQFIPFENFCIQLKPKADPAPARRARAPLFEMFIGVFLEILTP